MLRYAAFFTLLIAAAVACQNTKKGAASAFEPEKTFKQYCSGCHGERVATFVDRRWKKGNTKADIVKSISEGDVNAGMAAFGAVLKPDEISAMADYILKAIENGKQFEFNDAPKSNVFTSASMTVRLDTIVKGIGHPWGLAFLPNGDLLVTDRDGQLYRRGADGRLNTVAGAPPVLAESQGGLLDVSLHPRFAENKLIYLTYSKFIDSAGAKWATTALLRARLENDRLADQKDIFVAQPWQKTTYHYGSRVEFDRNGYLFLSVGDRGQHMAQLPQYLNNDCGKIHRLFDDGRIPPDNPFVKEAGARASIWSYGHRNPQGMAMNPATGDIWANEHGPRGGDELNRIQKGVNFGWPAISYGINYDGTILTPLTAKDGMEQPVTYWTPSIGACGMAFVQGDRYPAWKGAVLSGSLRFRYLNRSKISDGKVVEQESLLPNIGRLRCVEMGPDGFIYVAVEEPGFVFRLTPVVN